MATTLGTMKDSVYRPIRDDSRTFVTPADVTDWLNEAQLDLAIRLKVLPATASGVTAGSTIALPADFVEADSLLLDVDDEVEWVDDSVFNSYLGVESGNVNHYIGRIEGSNIELFPNPGTGVSYSFKYFVRPTAMAVDGDTFDLPDDLVPRAIKYAQAHAKYKEGEMDLGDRYLEMYERGLPPAPNTQTRTRPGPINVGYMPTAWDYDGVHRG